MGKKIMREFELDEISAVTVPAQKGARMVIMKRGDGQPDPADGAFSPRAPRDFSKLSDDELREMIAKGKMRLTTPVDGHQHLIDLDELAIAQGGGYTGHAGMGTQYDGHTHPYVIGDDGSIAIGMTAGHVHDVTPIPISSKSGESPRMTDSDLKELRAELAESRALASMTDAQKQHLAKLAGDERDDFIEADFSGREAVLAVAAKAAEAELAKKAGDDPVVYTSRDGTEYRKSDGEAAVKMAKSLDAAMAHVTAITDAANASEAERVAKEDMAGFGMDLAEKIKLAKDILALPPKMKDEQLATLRKLRDVSAPLFKSIGFRNAGDAVSKSAEDRLDDLAKSIAKQDGCTVERAYAKALRTDEGKALYSEAERERNAA